MIKIKIIEGHDQIVVEVVDLLEVKKILQKIIILIIITITITIIQTKEKSLVVILRDQGQTHLQPIRQTIKIK
jgi:hypothetical protein